VPIDAPAARTTGPHPLRRLAAVLIGTLFLTSALSGCFGHDAEGSEGTPESTGHPPRSVPSLDLRTAVTRVIGELPRKKRKRLAGEIDTVVGRYLRAAFLQPGSGSRDAAAAEDRFPAFTPGARTRAVRDRQLLTGLPFSDARRVEPRRATAYVAMLAPHGGPLGATARVRLELSVTTGDGTGPVTVTGRLLLTPTAHGWRIFGYDITRSGLASERKSR
jgi:hypothetical protein